MIYDCDCKTYTTTNGRLAHAFCLTHQATYSMIGNLVEMVQADRSALPQRWINRLNNITPLVHRVMANMGNPNSTDLPVVTASS